jgi:hypothetical protein
MEPIVTPSMTQLNGGTFGAKLLFCYSAVRRKWWRRRLEQALN